MKINTKGFTLVEIIVVIALIALLFVIAVPAAIQFATNNKEKLKETRITLIENAAADYGEDNSDDVSNTCQHLPSGVADANARCATVTLSVLYTNNYITNKDLIDPTTDTNLSGTVEIQYYYNRYYALYFE